LCVIQPIGAPPPSVHSGRDRLEEGLADRSNNGHDGANDIPPAAHMLQHVIGSCSDLLPNDAHRQADLMPSSCRSPGVGNTLIPAIHSKAIPHSIRSLHCFATAAR
jgi:hypothetical protein